MRARWRERQKRPSGARVQCVLKIHGVYGQERCAHRQSWCWKTDARGTLKHYDVALADPATDEVKPCYWSAKENTDPID